MSDNEPTPKPMTTDEKIRELACEHARQVLELEGQGDADMLYQNAETMCWDAKKRLKTIRYNNDSPCRHDLIAVCVDIAVAYGYEIDRDCREG